MSLARLFQPRFTSILQHRNPSTSSCWRLAATYRGRDGRGDVEAEVASWWDEPSQPQHKQGPNPQDKPKQPSRSPNAAARQAQQQRASELGPARQQRGFGPEQQGEQLAQREQRSSRPQPLEEQRQQRQQKPQQEQRGRSGSQRPPVMEKQPVQGASRAGKSDATAQQPQQQPVQQQQQPVQQQPLPQQPQPQDGDSTAEQQQPVRRQPLPASALAAAAADPAKARRKQLIKEVTAFLRRHGCLPGGRQASGKLTTYLQKLHKRGANKAGPPGPELLAELESIGSWWWEEGVEWERQCWDLGAFVRGAGRLPHQNKGSQEERQLGKWCRLQRRRRQGKREPALTAEQWRALEGIDGWQW